MTTTTDQQAADNFVVPLIRVVTEGDAQQLAERLAKTGGKVVICYKDDDGLYHDWKPPQAAPSDGLVSPEDAAEIVRFVESIARSRVGHFGTWTGYVPQLETGWVADILSRARRLTSKPSDGLDEYQKLYETLSHCGDNDYLWGLGIWQAARASLTSKPSAPDGEVVVPAAGDAGLLAEIEKWLRVYSNYEPLPENLTREIIERANNYIRSHK